MKKINQTSQDLIIIGGGIMGLMTAYFASSKFNKITIIEKLKIGNESATSFNHYSRSIYNGYLDTGYVNLARQSQKLWKDIENKSGKKLYIECGCLNIASKKITADIKNTYAQKSYDVRKKLGIKGEYLNQNQLKKRFPQFNADLGTLENDGGYLFLPAITKYLLKTLKAKQVIFIENITISKIEEKANEVYVQTNQGDYTSSKLVITAGLGTNEVLKTVLDNDLMLPLKPEPPLKMYLFPPRNKRRMFMPDKFPIFACLDIGIWGHPITNKEIPGVKIGYYFPQKKTKKYTRDLEEVLDFVANYIPALKDAKAVDYTDSIPCSYDLVVDDNFIVGKLPKYKNIVLGAGFLGTGYKFGPVIGKILTQLTSEDKTQYDISKFSPARFIM